MDFLRAIVGVGVAIFMMVAPQLGLPYMQAIPLVGEQGDAGGRDGETLARIGIEVGPRVPLQTLDAGGNRTALRVLWAEVEGGKLDRGGQGAGRVARLVTVIAGPGALALGNATVRLRPGDELTIEGFEGKWAYAPDGMVGLLRLEGSLLAARVGEKGLRPLTAEQGVAPGWALRGEPASANVTVTAGRTTFVSTEARRGEEVLRHLAARDVRINGARVEGTRWGEGPLDSVAFVGTAPGLLRGEGGARTLEQGQRVEVTDFIGAYVVFFAANDDARIALEGYARTVTLSAAAETSPGASGGNRPPVPGFDWAPVQPRAGEAVKFWDRSTDVDGLVSQREWRFGDGTTSREQHPSHAFESAGAYIITLIVTDNRLVSSSVSRNVTVLNVPPVASWESNPPNPSTLDTVQFADASRDADGRIIAWEWDFGDGGTSSDAHPAHRFADNGRYDVALKVWDDAGATSESTKSFEVRNLAPQARFSWLPAEPVSGQAIQFRDASVDQDGAITGWTWDFGGGARSSEPSPAHAFATKGPHRVTLTVRDDDGASHRWDSAVDVRNRPPLADFAFSPEPPAEGEAVRFRDLSSDPDGRVVERVWSFGDGSISTAEEPLHTYRNGGNITVSLTAKDDDGARSTAVRVVHVNRRPLAAFTTQPLQPSTEEPTRFRDASSDADGRVVAWAWDFGDGNTSAERHPEYRYARTGAYHVALTVADDEGSEGTLRRVLDVRNAGPVAAFAVEPLLPDTGHEATFRDLSTDADGSIVSWAWSFGDGASALGRTVGHRFAEARTYDVQLTVTDNDGQSATAALPVRVQAAPDAAFGFLPLKPTTASDVTFTDASADPDGTIVSWTWEFRDGATSSERSPVHRFAREDLYQVTLTVVDNEGARSTLSKPVVVGSLAPVAAFDLAPERPRAGEAVQFLDASHDPDGELRAWRWDFGGGATSTAQHPSHAFAGSGVHRVSLTVTDDAARATTLVRDVAVFGAQPLDLVLRVVYPDGQPVDLARSGLSMELRTTASGARLAKGDGLAAGPDGVARGTLPVGAWVQGELVHATVRMTSAQVDHTAQLPLLSGDLGAVVLPMSMQPRIVLAEPRTGSGKVYQNPAEQVHGHVLVVWKDGVPVSGSTVTLTFRWEQLGAPSFPVPALVGASGLTGDDGAFAFAVPYNLGLPEGPGAYVPGVYRVTAESHYVVSDGLARQGAQLTFVEDPGGARTLLTGR